MTLKDILHELVEMRHEAEDPSDYVRFDNAIDQLVQVSWIKRERKAVLDELYKLGQDFDHS